MDGTLKCAIHWKAVEQYFTNYLACNFGKLINFGLSTVGSEIIN